MTLGVCSSSECIESCAGGRRRSRRGRRVRRRGAGSRVLVSSSECWVVSRRKRTKRRSRTRLAFSTRVSVYRFYKRGVIFMARVPNVALGRVISSPQNDGKVTLSYMLSTFVGSHDGTLV